ncbi:MAG: HAMP domain-containing histidine kinase, partial [Muribaculaceae bacterium]|nr:HAMP domain-containing histidine kinase [Muribaculaceae bacterium]
IETLTEEVRAIERETYGKVIRTIAHEVNNTLGGIDSVLQVVKDVSEPDIAEVVENCRERSQKLTDFISAYATLVKLPEPRVLTMDLAESMEHLKPFITCYAEQADIRVDYHLEHGAKVNLDPILWEQAIINIIKNSVESIAETGREDGVIEVATDRLGQLTITDNGKGISDDQIARLHTPFYTTKSNGQGIGMMLIREILLRHKCKFTLLTEKSTKKTTFRIFFQAEY